MTSSIQRVGDQDDVGAFILSSGQNFVYCNDVLVSIEFDPVSEHGDDPHKWPFTANGSAFNFISGGRIIIAGSFDSCGHQRVGGSTNTFSD